MIDNKTTEIETSSNDLISISYTFFEVRMGQIFHTLYGSSTQMLHEQSFWPAIQELKKLAQEELPGGA